jgi:DNA-binding beta-propeller fold protein YncE
MPATGRRLLAMSPDGRAAYLAAADRSILDVVDVAANGAPKVVYTLDIDKQPVLVLAAAARAWTVALVRAKDVMLLDLTSSAVRPVRSALRPLPPEIRDVRIVSADLSPDGKTLAVATDEGNKVTLLDVSARGQATTLTSLSVVPDARESIIADVAFSPMGDTLWITTGDTDRSRASGPQPTQVHAARLENGALNLARTVTIREAGGPDRLSTGRTIPLASGSAIRLPPERATVFVAARAATAEGKEAGATPNGVVFRVGAEDAATAMLTEAGRFGQPDLSPDGRWLLTSLIAPDGSVRLFAARADARPGAPRSVPLLGPTPKPAGRDHQLPSVRVQP